MQQLRQPTRRAALPAGVVALTGCQQAANYSGRGTAAGVGTGAAAAATTAQQSDADTAEVVRSLGRLGARPVSTLSIATARA